MFDKLNAVDILMLHYAPSYIINQEDFQVFWKHRYNVEPKKILTKLINLGYLEPGNIKSSIPNYVISDLKSALKKYNLKCTGKKQDLIDRLIENVDEAELLKSFPNIHYVLAEEGKKAISNFDEVVFIHGNPNYNIDIYEVFDEKQHNPKFVLNDYIWGSLNKSYLKDISNNNWGLARNDRMNMANLMLKERRYEQALNLLIEVCYMDISGMDNGHSINFLSMNPENLKYQNSLYKIMPDVLKKINDICNILQYDKNIKYDYIKNVLLTLHMPFHLFTKEEAYKIILCEFNNDEIELIQLYNTAKTRFEKKYCSENPINTFLIPEYHVGLNKQKHIQYHQQNSSGCFCLTLLITITFLYSAICVLIK